MKLFIIILFSLLCATVFANELKWHWAEIDLAKSLSLKSSGTAKVAQHGSALNITLLGTSNNEPNVLLCDREDRDIDISCVDQLDRKLNGYLRRHSVKGGIIDLDSGLFYDSANTYVLYRGVTMIIVTRYHEE